MPKKSIHSFNYNNNENQFNIVPVIKDNDSNKNPPDPKKSDSKRTN